MNTPLFFRRASRSDLSALVRLLGQAVPKCASDTVWALPWSWPRYRVIEHDSAIVAAASLQPTDSGHVEIRGVAIEESWRGRGLGSRLVRYMIEAAEGRDVLCITDSPEFFERQGFVETAPTWLSPQRHLRTKTGEPKVAMVAHGTTVEERAA